MGAVGFGFDFRAGDVQRLATAATFLRSCVAQVLSCGVGPAKIFRNSSTEKDKA